MNLPAKPTTLPDRAAELREKTKAKLFPDWTVDIYVTERRDGELSVRIPWLPEQIEFKTGGIKTATYNIMNRGPVEVPTGTGLWSFKWDGIFPGKKRTDLSMFRVALVQYDMSTQTWVRVPPSTYHDIFVRWRDEAVPLTLRVVGYPFNKDVILTDYYGKATGGFGDIEYTAEFTEDRDITIESVTVDNAVTETKRQAAEPTSYTVVKGDTLWKIAMSQCGYAAKASEIYKLNYEIIELTAKEHGMSSSCNGHWIFPGTVLKLPSKDTVSSQTETQQQQQQQTAAATTTSSKTVDEIAKEVIAGKWGNGAVRKEKLTKAGYDYNAVQKRVNEMLK